MHDIDSKQILEERMSAAILKIMHLSRIQDLQNCLAEFVQLIKILHFRDKMDLIRTLLTYSFAVSEDLEPKELSAILEKEMDKEVGEKIMSVAERLFKDGERKGFAEGEARGEARGKAEGLSEGENRGEIRVAQRTLYKLYVKKFSIDPKIEKQIQSIHDLEKLEDLIVDFSDFTGKEEFLLEMN